MKNIERDFSEISDALVTAFQNWEIWWLFKSERPKYANIMNHYLEFFFDEPDKFIEGDAERLLQDLINYNSKTV